MIAGDGVRLMDTLKPLCVGGWLFFLVGCDPVIPVSSDHGPEVEVEPPYQQRVVDYQCGDLPLQVRFSNGDSVLLVLPWRDLRLPARVAASGALYQQDSNRFHGKGDMARLTLDGQADLECQTTDRVSPWARARDSGLRWRVVGNEPGWLAELGGLREEGAGEPLTLRAVLDYGRRELQISELPEPGPDNIYQARIEGDLLTLALDEQPCQDSMSGWVFPVTARLEFAGQVYRGCGRYFEVPW